MTTAVGDVVGRLIEENDQQAAGLELSGVEQGADVGLQPAVRSLEPAAKGTVRGAAGDAAMRVIDEVGHYEGVVRQLERSAGSDVRGELLKGNDIGGLGRALLDITEVGEGIVVSHVRTLIAANIPGRGERLCVDLPGFADCSNLANDIVGSHGTGVVIVIGDGEAGGHDEVVGQ